MASSQTRPELFVDRSLGRRVLPDALRAEGFVVHTMWSVYGPDAEERITDVRWITEGAARGWVLLTKDAKMRHRSVELEAIDAAGARVFLLTNQHLKGRDQADLYVKHINRIVRLSRKPGPYVYGVYRDRIERLWP